jgi:hypothetical protein
LALRREYPGRPMGKRRASDLAMLFEKAQ